MEQTDLLFAAIAGLSLLFAVVPALLFLRNLQVYTRPRFAPIPEPVSVLIPARNEEECIAKCVYAALQSEAVELEVIVLDDYSDDGTADVVRQIARTENRVHLAEPPSLPPGWCGKQFACSVLAQLSSNPVLCFLDADVKLEPRGLARMIGELRSSGAALISGFPRQITITPLEQLLLPLMHFILLGYLPLDQMRKSLQPSLGAGCGQLFVADREAYFRAGGHSAIRESRHDGIALPRAFRRAGFKTDLCDATEVASCRMYTSAQEVVSGLLKNANEGLAHPKRIVPFSVILFFGQILPALLVLFLWISSGSRTQKSIAVIALFASYVPRIVAVFRFRQPAVAGLLHPVSIFGLLCIQWVALVRALLRVPATWKGRSYSTS